MILALVLSLALQVRPQTPTQTPTQRMVDSITREVNRRVNERAAAREKRDAKRASEIRRVTPEVLATAFKDPFSKTLLERARVARLSQDSALLSYDVNAYQRISAGIGFNRLGRDRLVFRSEVAGRVKWHRDVGLWIEMTGARTVLPGVPEIGERETKKALAKESNHMLPIPYFPGHEALWSGPETARPTIAEEGPIHPLAEGSEAYYTYKTGDSLMLTLPDNRVIHLRALEIRPRDANWKVVVGSLWFEEKTGQLVRAVYRFAVPMHIDGFVLDEDPTAFDDVPAWIKPAIFPMHGEIKAVAIEYGLYGGRFWLPRLRSAEGVGTASFMRVPFKAEQSFKYHSVNGLDSLPKIALAPNPLFPPDSLTNEQRIAWRDSVRSARLAAARARRDSLREGIRRGRPITQCDTSDVTVSSGRRFGDAGIPVAVRTPCNLELLESSPDLPKSIYDPGDELFDLKAREALITEALSMGVQPPFTLNPRQLPRPEWATGLRLMRYNRVEGLSAGLGISQVLGGGYTVDALGRIGVADRIPNLELTLTRSNLSNAVYASGYSRLVSAGDWGNPLSFGSSLSAVLFGRDEGFYYRAAGAQIGGRSERGTPIDWRVFVERQRSAFNTTSFSLGGTNAAPNIEATSGTYAGSAVRVRHTYGLDPNGFRIFTDLRLEGAAGDSTYGRSALDLTFTSGLGSMVGALTLSSGNSVGAVPAHRRWYLGGTHTVRGQSPDTAHSGNAYWMARAELGQTIQGTRPVVFSDIGWVGDRGRMREVGRPLSGAGFGLSILDGLMRFDVARGIHPRKQWRVDMYVEAVF
jgi:hypothetical protein